MNFHDQLAQAYGVSPVAAGPFTLKELRALFHGVVECVRHGQVTVAYDPKSWRFHIYVDDVLQGSWMTHGCTLDDANRLLIDNGF